MINNPDMPWQGRKTVPENRTTSLRPMTRERDTFKKATAYFAKDHG